MIVEFIRPTSNDITQIQVAYHDVPDRAYEVFLSAVTTKYLEQGLVIPSLVEAHNPAGKQLSGI